MAKSLASGSVPARFAPSRGRDDRPQRAVITERVTNWTLSDRRRRIEIAVSVAYASAPEKVVAVLRAVAQGHPQVLKDPAPQALLIAFGDSAIDSELRAWSAPNVVIVLIDDMGFGQPSTFGVKRKATTASPVASTGSRSR